MTVGAGFYAVVDPVDSTAILYLSDKDYKRQVRVSLSQDLPLVVLARPGDSRVTQPDPTSSSPNTPPKNSPKGLEMNQFGHVRVYFPDGSWTWAPPGPSTGYFPIGPDGMLPRGTKRRYVDPLLGTPIRATQALETGLVPFEVSGPRARFQFLGWHISRLRKLMTKVRQGESLVVPTAEVLLTLILHWGTDLSYRLGGPLDTRPALTEALLTIGKDLCRILLTRGRTALVSKMKNTIFFLNNWLGGMMNTNPFLLGEPVGLARSGLPRILPLYIRRQIASKNWEVIRLTISLFKSYTAFDAPHVPTDLSSVIGSQPVIDTSDLEEFRVFCKDIFWGKVVRKYALAADHGEVLKPVLRLDPRSRPYIPVRGGPNSATALLGAPHDAIAWANALVNWPMEWARHVGDTRTEELFGEVLKAGQDMIESRPKDVIYGFGHATGFSTGKLGILPEPAGKVRIIAIADYWTQRLMKPVHDWMMKVLSCLPTDGTFNQEQALKSYSEETSSAGVTRHHSIDLKSATDLIPIDLYSAMLEGILDEHTVALWRSLLTDRFFRVPKDNLVEPRLHRTDVMYGRGQPMGTLSSWPSMALVHHAIELFAAHRAGIDPLTFTRYRVLGDDNVTGDCLVAKSYLEVCERLHVPISLHKTQVGRLFTFASQVYLDGKNISPLSLKEEMGIQTYSQRLEMALRAVSRGWVEKPTTARFLRLLLRKRDYVRSVRSFNEGRLGHIAQAALVSAFGIAGQALARAGFRESTCIPFLLAMQGKIQALGGDRSHLDKSTLDNLSEIENLVVISLAKQLNKILIKEVELIRESSIRFQEWRESVHDLGLIPLSWRKGPKSWILNIPWRTWDELPVEERTLDPLGWGLFSQAIWPVLEDTYGPYIGSSTIYPDVSDYTLGMSHDIGESRVDRGTGVTFDSNPSSSVTTVGGWRIPIPGLIQEVQELSLRAEALIQGLVKGLDNGSPVGDPWSYLVELLEVKASFPAIPEFYTLSSLEPDRSPKSVDLLRSWVRQMKAFHELLGYLPLQVDFSMVVDTQSGELTEHEESLRAAAKAVTKEFISKQRVALRPGLA
jgi:hypothetical protein